MSTMEPPHEQEEQQQQQQRLSLLSPQRASSWPMLLPAYQEPSMAPVTRSQTAARRAWSEPRPRASVAVSQVWRPLDRDAIGFDEEEEEEEAEEEREEQEEDSGASSRDTDEFSRVSDTSLDFAAATIEAQAPRTHRPKAIAWVALGILVGLVLASLLPSLPSIFSPTTTTNTDGADGTGGTSACAAACASWGPQDFNLLHSLSLQAFNVSEMPPLDAAPDVVNECQRQVRRGYRRLALVWHEDTCKYKAIMHKWQCSEMFKMLDWKLHSALEDCRV